MPRSLHALSVVLALLLASLPLKAQQPVPTSERDKVGYMLGLDIGRSVAPASEDIDMAAFRRALENAIAGGEPLLKDDVAQKTGQALMGNILARKAGNAAKPIDRANVGLLLGTDVGRSLKDVGGEFDMPMFLRGVADGADQQAQRALDDAEVNRVRVAFSARIAAERQARRQAKAEAALREEEAFLARNKQEKGVFSTPSGLQYMVLRQGDGVRPRPGQKVKVHYEGKLLDGTVFDSSYTRGQPTEFRLDQVITGWTEGVGMMPIGGKYRFWLPARLAYGETGAGEQIPPNATLTFDIELLGVD